MSGLMNPLSVEVEISTFYSSNGMPYSIFSPENPFIRRDCRPLPWWDCDSKFNIDQRAKREIHWIIEEELTITPPSINLAKAFNCFNIVPSAGAKYSIKLCVDVPDNNSPLQLPSLITSELGHSFVVVSKWNGNRYITQVFGFYAQKYPSYLDPFSALPSTIRDNQLKEINASIEMSITAEQFDLLRKKAYELAKHKYAAADYNCTNYGLDLFNSVRAKPITIESYVVSLPSASYSALLPTEPNLLTIGKTPQKLFKKLKEMKDCNDPEASSILIDQTTHSKAPFSHGECE